MLGLNSYGQAEFKFPDVEAHFIGGKLALQKYIDENIELSKKTINDYPAIKVYVTFTVEPDGSITRVKAKSEIKIFNKEATRLVSNMPRWIPAELNGLTISQHCRIPINFK